jgi:hypothetical protein
MERGVGSRPIAKSILKLARQIDASGTPEYISVEVGEGCEPGDSNQNVTTMVRKFGGAIQHGWAFRIQPLAYVEGAFHAVWRKPDGSLVDVTPRKDEQSVIPFMVDLRNTWQGEEIEPRRMMLHEQPCYCGSGMPYKICHGLADE